MQKLSNIYSRTRLGIDYRVWLIMLLASLLSLALLGFKLSTTERCQPRSLLLKGVMEHDLEHYYYTGENITFTADMKNTTEVVWDFGDGSEPVSGRQVSHSYKNEGNYLLTAVFNGRCRESVNVHISQVSLRPVALPSNSDNTAMAIIGKDFAGVGELNIYQTDRTASAYEWTVENNPAYAVKNGDKVSYSFTDAGSYTIRLKLDNDDSKVYRKTIIVNASAAKNAGVMPDELPPLPLPAPQEKQVVPDVAASGNESGAAAGPASAAGADRKFEVIPNQIFKDLFQEIADGKATPADVAKYLCDGANTKVRGNGKTFSNLSLFCDELKGKKGMLGLGGKRKIKAVNAKREIGSNCVYWLDVEYK